MEGSILELLEQHGALAYEQIAAHLRRPTDWVRTELVNLRACGWIDVLEIAGLRDGPGYWRLTEAGREELARKRAG